MKGIRNVLLALGLAGSSFGAGVAVDNVLEPGTVNDCRPGWQQVGSGRILETGAAFITCALPDGTEVSIFSDGTFSGYDFAGNRLANPRTVYEAAR